ncbi:MAG: hypothetical protein M3Y84_05315, partial [Acidobacteriota bacterium]|nr:hypothetical protein [Acidobacteriota bacterium]
MDNSEQISGERLCRHAVRKGLAFPRVGQRNSEATPRRNSRGAASWEWKSILTGSRSLSALRGG